MAAGPAQARMSEEPDGVGPARLGRGGTVAAATLGEAWLAVAAAILAEGARSSSTGSHCWKSNASRSKSRAPIRTTR